MSYQNVLADILRTFEASSITFQYETLFLTHSNSSLAYYSARFIEKVFFVLKLIQYFPGQKASV